MARKSKKQPDIRRTKQFLTLKKSMLDNLSARGLAEDVYRDKVDEYMDFWVRRRELQEDIAQRGLTVMDDRGRISENRSVSLEVQVSRQMLAIFSALGFKEDAVKGGGSVEDDEL